MVVCWPRRASQHDVPSLSPTAEHDASYVSRLTFSWISPLIRRGCVIPLELSDLPPLVEKDQSSNLGSRFHDAYRCIAASDIRRLHPGHINSTVRSTTNIKSLPLLSRCASYLTGLVPPNCITVSSRALLIVTAPTFLSAVLVKPIWLLGAIVQTFCINFLLKRLALEHIDPAPPTTRWVYLPVVFGLALAGIAQSVSMHATFALTIRSGIRARAAIASQVYRKVLRLDPSTFAAFTSEGELGNLLVTDLQRIFDAFQYFHFFWQGIIELTVICALLSIELGMSALVGFGFLVLLIPVQMFLSSFIGRARAHVTKVADLRVQKMNETLTGIRFIKYSVWEDHFHNTIQQLRRKEIKYLTCTAVVRAVNAALFFIAPILVSLISFTSYTLIFNRHLTPAIAFVSVSFYATMSRILSLLPIGWLGKSEASISFQRLDKFFNMSELPSVCPEDRLDIIHQFECSSGGSQTASLDTPGGMYNETPRVRVSQASFTYSCEIDSKSHNTTPTVSDIVLEAGDGGLICIVGAVGSGKSTILSGILGELRCTTGFVQKRGRVAYCAQEPWIVNGTFRENVIMFGELEEDTQFNKIWYDLVIEKCCLRVDIEGFPAGDKTEIGERGINLSGGQKARLALARAVYSQSDVYILDDPLSAVDASVLSNLISGLFGHGGLLSQKAQIIATHQASLLRCASNVVVLDEGRIAQSGTYNELTELGVNFSGLQKVANIGDADGTDPSGELKEIDAGDGETFAEDILKNGQVMPNVEGSASMVMTVGDFKSESSSEQTQGDEKQKQQGKDLENGEREVVEAAGPKVPNSENEHITSGESNSHGIASSDGDRSVRIEKVFNEANAILGTMERSRLAKTDGSLDAPSSPGTLVKERNEEDGTGTLVTDEDRNVGRVSWPIFKAYIRSGGGFLVLLGILLVLIGTQATRQLSKVWVGYWTSGVEKSLDRSSDEFFAGNLAFVKAISGLAIGALMLSLLQAVLFAFFAMVSSRRLHNRLLHRILHAKMSFFDTNPIGRILNRFSKDVDQMDIALPVAMQEVIQFAFSAVGILITVCWILPWFLIVLVPVVISFLYVQGVYKMSSRELKRLDGVSASSTYAKFVETLSGMATIRAFGFEQDFAHSFEGIVDKNHRTMYAFQFANRWLGFRLDALVTFCVFCTASVILGLGASVDIGLAGVALTESILMMGAFQWGVRQAAETENIFTSVERVLTMAEETPVEAGYGDGDVDGDNDEPNENWPSQGAICFSDVVLKYRPDLEAALNGITFSTGRSERVGIVGRTGSGKSSLLVSLFRIVEVQSGSITIDGHDISKVSLHDLRSRMAIVPQDPVLFTGTVRSNLDPMGRCSDRELWDALRKVNMGDVVSGISQEEGSGDSDLATGLDGLVREKGSNFSIGERQLLSMARVILSGVKVVVLDEASASLDNHTDMLIQRTVREQLCDRTVLTIAHRLATVVDCDRVLVVDSGTIVEFDSPMNLMNRDGYFAHLVSECGPGERQHLEAKMKPRMSDAGDIPLRK